MQTETTMATQTTKVMPMQMEMPMQTETTMVILMPMPILQNRVYTPPSPEQNTTIYPYHHSTHSPYPFQGY